LIEFNGFIDGRTLDRVRRWLTYADEVQECTEQNYQLAKRYYSFTVLERYLHLLLADCLGEMSQL
jgi:mannosylglucosylglycerate synthase